MLLYYIRHGDPIYDPDQLTPLGQQQAHAVAKRLARYGFDHIYTSTSQRAIQTAQPLCDLLKLEPMQLDWCHERHAHRLFSAPTADGKRNFASANLEIRKLFNSKEMLAMGEMWYTHPRLAGERFQEGLEFYNGHTDALLEKHGYRRDDEENWYIPVNDNDERIAIFAHWGVGGAIMSHILGIPYPQFVSRFALSHSTMSIVEFKVRGDIVIPQALTYGNDSHLYRDGLPTKFENRLYI